MKLALFSYKHSQKELNKLSKMVGKPASKIKVAFVITAVRAKYKEELPEWANPENNELSKYFGSVEIFDILDHLDDGFDFSKFFKSKDIVYFSGGNVFFLNYYLKKSGVGNVLIKLIKSDRIVYAGGSAGALVMMKNIGYYKSIDEPEQAPELVKEGLGLIEFALIVHWKSGEYDHALEKIKHNYDNDGIKTITITDEEAVFVIDDKIEKL